MSVIAAPLYEDGKEDPIMPWEEHGWVPVMKSGKQKSPNVIRGEIQRYIDNSSETQTAILSRMHVNSASFRRFMNPKTYKDQWSAVQNSTYWAAARLLAQHEYEKKKPPKSSSAAGTKRKALDDVSNGCPPKKSKAELQTEANDLIQQINSIEGAISTIYDSCPEVVRKIKEFLNIDGVTKAAFCAAIGGVNNNSLSRFLAAKGQDGATNCVYPAAYLFFEKKRILDKKPKSKARIKHEAEFPTGHSLERLPKYSLVFVGDRFAHE